MIESTESNPNSDPNPNSKFGFKIVIENSFFCLQMAETGESSTQKRPFIPNVKDIEDIEDEAPAKTQHLKKKFNKGGPKFDEVWKYFIQGEEVNSGHYKVSCCHCKKEWARGKPAALKAHLANECLPCPEEISRYWREKLIESKVNYTRRLSVQNDDDVLMQPLPTQSKITQHFGLNTPLSSQASNRIDQSLLKAWVMAGIPFEVIENPFIVDLFKDLNPGYVLPSRFTLSGQLLDKEVARVNNKIDDELKESDGLTLSKNIYNLSFFFKKKNILTIKFFIISIRWVDI